MPMARPVCTEMMPGNTADVAILLPIVQRLRSRFGITRACIVADRGMISQATITALRGTGSGICVGCARAHRRTHAPGSRRSATPHAAPRRAQPGRDAALRQGGSSVDGVRYIVCRNEAQAEKDREDRQAIIAALDTQLKKGDKALVGNSAYRRYLNTTTRDAFEIDAGKIAEEARYDGIFVLRTNARISPLQAMLRYRDLLTVETLFRVAKATLSTRPDLPFIRCRHPRPRLLLLPRPDAAQGAVRPLPPKPVSNPSGVRSCVISTACRAAKSRRTDAALPSVPR